MDIIFGGDCTRIRPSYGTVYQENITYHLTNSGEFYSQITSFRGLISPLHLIFGTPLHLRYNENQLPTITFQLRHFILVRLRLHTYVLYCSSVRIQVCMKYCNCIQYVFFLKNHLIPLIQYKNYTSIQKTKNVSR